MIAKHSYNKNHHRSAIMIFKTFTSQGLEPRLGWQFLTSWYTTFLGGVGDIDL